MRDGIPEEDWPEYIEPLAWERVYHQDYTQDALAFLDRAFEGTKVGKGPKAGLDLLMGNSTLLRFENLLKCLKEGRVEVCARLFEKV